MHQTYSLVVVLACILFENVISISHFNGRINYVRQETCVIYLGQLFRDVPAHKHRLQVDPKVLDSHPVFYNIGGVRKILNPLLNLGFEWGVVPGKQFTSAWKPPRETEGLNTFQIDDINCWEDLS